MVSKDIVGVIAIDDGGSSTKVVTKDTQEMFPSVKGYYGNRNLTEVRHKHDFIVSYKNKDYIAGEIAKYDCSMPLQIHTKSKQHDFYDLSVLIAIHQYGYASNNVIVSTPIKSYTTEERDGRLNRLRGSHTIKINGITKTFSIADVKVAPESASAFWVDEPEGKTHIIDFGSRTIGAATTLKKDGTVRFIDSESDTFFGKGIEALEDNYNPMALADYVCGRLTKMWDREDSVRLIGGGSLDAQLVTQVKEYFPRAIVMDNAVMASSIGMYNLGRSAYGIH